MWINRVFLFRYLPCLIADCVVIIRKFALRFYLMEPCNCSFYFTNLFSVNFTLHGVARYIVQLPHWLSDDILFVVQLLPTTS